MLRHFWLKKGAQRELISTEELRVGSAKKNGRAQRTSSTARKFLTKRKIRRKLGDYGQISSALYAAEKAARHVAADV